jgi:hypothetical protein
MKTTHSALSLKAFLVLASFGLAAPALGADATREERDAARAAGKGHPAQVQVSTPCGCPSMRAHGDGK